MIQPETKGCTCSKSYVSPLEALNVIKVCFSYKLTAVLFASMPAVTQNSSSPVFPLNSVRGLRIDLVCPTGHIPRLSMKKLFLNYFFKSFECF